MKMTEEEKNSFLEAMNTDREFARSVYYSLREAVNFRAAFLNDMKYDQDFAMNIHFIIEEYIGRRMDV